jgi:RimK family alpha-L-glutamate ligase
MQIGIITRDENGWCSTQLKEALKNHGATPVCFSFHQIVSRIGYKPQTMVKNIDLLKDLEALIIRPIGRGSLEEIIFRMDILHRLHRNGKVIVNPPLAIERSIDKFYALTLLEENGIPVPRTVVTESSEEAVKTFNELGGDVVIKPIFGSRGVGSTHVSDVDIATRIFRTLSFYHNVIYIQEFIPHKNSDIRAFVVGNRVVAAMRRLATNWKTNVSQGAEPKAIRLPKDLEDLAVKAAKVIGCKIAGIDILEGPQGPLIIELNSQPGWRGLQSVSDVSIAEEIIKFLLQEIKS